MLFRNLPAKVKRRPAGAESILVLAPHPAPAGDPNPAAAPSPTGAPAPPAPAGNPTDTPKAEAAIEATVEAEASMEAPVETATMKPSTMEATTATTAHLCVAEIGRTRANG
jgi:hypothetical protein